MKFVIGLAAIAAFLFTATAYATVNTDTDFCDPSQRPAGMSIAEWLAENDFDSADCFDINVVEECGVADVSLATMPKDLFYQAVWMEGDVDPIFPANEFPAEFEEDYNDGSVVISWWLEGPEADYLEDTRLPNFWDNRAGKLTVNTDCESEPGSITIIKNADGAGNLAFDFDGSLGNFNLTNDESIVFSDLTADSYTINEVATSNWELDEIACVGADTTDNDVDDGDVRIHLDAGEDATCVFTNVAIEVEPTSTAMPIATATPMPTSTPNVVVVTVEVPTLISPPSTGTGGIR